MAPLFYGKNMYCFITEILVDVYRIHNKYDTDIYTLLQILSDVCQPFVDSQFVKDAFFEYVDNETVMLHLYYINDGISFINITRYAYEPD